MTRLTHVLRVAAIALAAVLVLAACGEDNKVGSDKLTDFKEGTPNTRLGQTTTTAAPETTTTTAAAGGPATTAKATTTTAKPQASLTISIQSDEAGKAFEPTVAQVLQNSVVAWKNNDSKPRSVVFDDNTEDSGLIGPGATWEYTAKRAGTINYHDGTRPYAVASLQVVAR